MDDPFLTRLLRFDPQALVRLRPAGPGQVALWAALPWGVLVTRTVPGFTAVDRTVSAADLLAGADMPRARDSEWRWALPPAAADCVELLPAEVVRDVARAAARTLRSAMESGVDGRPVGSRALRDALLDHVVITVTVDKADSAAHGRTVEVRQRVVQAVTRMGLLGEVASLSEGPGGASATRPPVGDTVAVLLAGPWIGLATSYGAAWHRTGAPTLRPR
jgi:hypothetical protein